MIGITKEWQDFALALKIKRADIDAIAENNKDVKDCLSTVMKDWFKARGNKVSWENLCQALRDDLVDRGDLAETIEKNYR